MKFKLPKMPKVKMPDIVGNAKKLGKAIGKEVSSKIKGAVKGLKGLNPFKK
jgi:ribosomal protein L7Ae-like RNA K-turn-binding protein